MSHTRNKQGFTLIELVIVLAIAALIIAGVLLAVGGAQRSQRDSSTKSAAAQVAQALENAASNNNGVVPNTALAASYLTNVKDGNGNAPSFVAAPNAGAASTNPGIIYAGQAKCSGGSGVTGTIVAGTTRQYAVTYWVENGGQNVCLDNT
jgi:prepilin-type N-terminal cleavage/methylation domain-containing protein